MLMITGSMRMHVAPYSCCIRSILSFGIYKLIYTPIHVIENATHRSLLSRYILHICQWTLGKLFVYASFETPHGFMNPIALHHPTHRLLSFLNLSHASLRVAKTAALIIFFSVFASCGSCGREEQR